MHRTILLTFVLFTVAVGCREQSHVPTSEDTMSYTLDVSGERTVPNPTEADIRTAVFALDTTKNAAFLILGQTKMTYIQTSGDTKAGFELEYQESDVKHHYRAKRRFTADEIVKALVSYMSGTAEWKQMTEWEPIKW